MHSRFGAGAIAILPVVDALEIAILADAAAVGTVAADQRQLHWPSSAVIEGDMLFVADLQCLGNHIVDVVAAVVADL